MCFGKKRKSLTALPAPQGEGTGAKSSAPSASGGFNTRTTADGQSRPQSFGGRTDASGQRSVGKVSNAMTGLLGFFSGKG